MNKSKDKYLLFAFIAMVCLVILQRFSINRLYYPVMDDWFLYGDTYSAYADKLSEFIIPNEKFSIRPMAAIIDTFFVAPLYGKLWLIELIMTLSLVTGVFLIMDALRKREFSAGGFFAIFMCLLPLNMEATYWLAASIRVSGSVLFVGLSLWFSQKYLTSGKWRFLIAYFIAGFLAVSFYEPAVAVYVCLEMYLVLSDRTNRAKWLFIAFFLHMLFISLYYILNFGSAPMERGAVLNDGIMPHTAEVAGMMSNILTRLNFRLISSGLRTGLSLIIDGEHAVQYFAAAVFSVAFGWFAGVLSAGERKFDYKKILLGIFFGLAGIALFYVLQDDRITLRSVYFVFLGIGLIFDELFFVLPGLARRIVVSTLVSVLTCVFTLSGMGVADSYKNISQKDMEIAAQIKSLSDAENGDKKIYVFGAIYYYKDIETPAYYESVRCACSGYSDITGCLWHVEGTDHSDTVTPVKSGDNVNLIEYVNGAENVVLLALDENETVIRLNAEQTEDAFYLVDEAGQMYGVLNEVDYGVYLFEKCV